MVNAVFILLITAFFTIPILEFSEQAEYSIFNPDRMRTSPAWTGSNTIEPWQFLKDKVEENGVSFVLGVPTIIMLSISILSYRYIDKKYKDFYITNMILGIICLFMSTKYFPWKLMPQIFTNIQYPWRLIGFALFFLIPVMVMNIYYLIKCIKKINIKNLAYIGILFILAIFTFKELSVYSSNDLNVDSKYEKSVKNNPIISHFSVNRDYLPLKAGMQQGSYTNSREDRVYVLSGEAVIEKEEKYALNMNFCIGQASKDTIIELPYLFYPGYTVKLINNNNVTILDTSESTNGFIQISLPEDVQNGSMSVEYTGTILEKWGYAISGVSFILFLEYIIYSKKYENINTIKRKIKEEKNERKAK